jgi:hypothetical protein
VAAAVAFSPMAAWYPADLRFTTAARSMPQPRRRRYGPQRDCRRALELLAASHDGCTEAIMLAQGFTIEQMNEFVRAGLATATAERAVGPLIRW